MSTRFVALAVAGLLLSALLGFPSRSLATPNHLAAISSESTAEGSAEQGQGKEKAKDKGKAEAPKSQNDWKDPEHNRRLVLDYYHRQGLPPGLAKRESLPPGLEKQLRERGQLPPGLEKRLVVLPPQLERMLPPLPPHYERRFLGDDLLIIDFRANTIVGHIAAVLPRY